METRSLAILRFTSRHRCCCSILWLDQCSEMKLKILAHHWLGLVGTYWLGRQVGLSRYAGLLAAGAFMLSTWYSLHLFVGHTQFLSMAFVPWVLAFIHRARRAPRRSVNIVAGAAFLALIVFEGGIYTIIFTVFLSGMLALCWSIQERSWVPVAVLVLSMSLGAGLVGREITTRRTTHAARTHEKLQLEAVHGTKFSPGVTSLLPLVPMQVCRRCWQHPAGIWFIR